MPREIVELEIYPCNATLCDKDCPYFNSDMDEESDDPNMDKYVFCDLFHVSLPILNENNIALRCIYCLKYSKPV